MRVRALVPLLVPLALAVACQPEPRPAGPERTLASFPAASLDELVSRTGVSVDREVSSDGDGSLRIQTSGSTTLQLWVAEDTAVDDAFLFYRAKLRSEGLEGRAYLEMWAHFPGKGEFFSRGFEGAISGDTDWSRRETPFVLEAGQQPDYVKLNLAIEGAGTVWIDEASLVVAPRT